MTYELRTCINKTEYVKVFINKQEIIDWILNNKINNAKLYEIKSANKDYTPFSIERKLLFSINR